MASMKSLFTITVLLVVGVYLYKTINEGPVRPPASAPGAGQAGAGVPPLAAAGSGATLAQDSAAPGWPPAASTAASMPPVLPPGVAPAASPAAAATTAPANSTAASDPANNQLPEVPPIPELPELPKSNDVLPPSTPAAPPVAASASPAAPAATIEPIPSAVASTAEATVLPTEQTATAPNAPAATAPANPSAVAAPAAAVTPAPGDAAQSAATSPPPLGAPVTPIPATDPPANVSNDAVLMPTTASGDRYGLSTNSAPLSAAPATSPTRSTAPAPAVPTPTAPAESSSFAASWPAIQAALEKNDLNLAHQLLSKWHGDETLAPVDTQKVETLLGQLAGTVIYSNEHRLEPARVVKPGETLETIAKEYNVPWQLLAKINSIPAPDQVRPGQELKVVRGPFSAIVNLRRSELTLEVDGRYAGTFPVTVPPGTAVTEGQWWVDQKTAGQPSAVAPAAYTPPPSSAGRAIVLRAAADATVGGAILTIASGNAATPGSPGSAAIQVAPQDAEELSDILSVGSRVVVRK